MEQWWPLIRKYASMFGVPEGDVYAVIKTESSGDPSAWNPRDPSYGLMGLMLPTAHDMGYQGQAYGLFDPETNIMIGTKYLAWIRSRWNTTNPAEVYSAFNSGSPTKYQTSSEVRAHVAAFLQNLAEAARVLGAAALSSPAAPAVAGGAVALVAVGLLLLSRRKGR